MAAIRFLFDEHVPRVLAEALRRRGILVMTAAEAGLLGAPDTAYLVRGREERYVLVTQDSDFLKLHQDGMGHTGIAYCAQGTRSIGQMINSLVLIHDVLDDDDMDQQIEFL